MVIMNMAYLKSSWGGWKWWDNLDISTAILSKQFSTGYGFQWLYINPDENVALTSSFWVGDWTVRWYSYSNKDISTCSLTWTNTATIQSHSVCANATWTHIYVWKHWYSNPTSWWVYEYSTTNWSVANMASYKNKTLWHIVQTVWINPAETYMVIFGWATLSDTTVYLYNMTTPWDVSTATLVKSVNVSKSYHWLFFNDEMTKCVACEYSASSWTVYQYDRDILNSNTYTQTHSFWPIWFTVGYPNINEDATRMYLVNESWYIYEYTLS